MAILSATTAVNDAVAGAKSLPGLISNLQALDPALATQLEAKPLLFSKTPWGTLAAGLIGWASARYGLGLDANTTALIAGLCVLAGSYAMRAVTKQPTSGLVTVTPPVVSATTAQVAPLLALLVVGLALSACTSVQETRTLVAARQVCAAHAIIVVVEPGLVAAHPTLSAQADAACAVVAAEPAP